MNRAAAVLSTAYFPPIQYLSKFIAFREVFLEEHENYCKQSYRNRCLVMGANGPLTLSVPVKKENTPKIPIKEARLDYDTPWNRIHWKAIQAAYRNSPFYLYYIDAIAPYFEREHAFLFDFNTEILLTLLKLTGIEHKWKPTVKFERNPSEAMDYRNSIHPKPSHRQHDPLFGQYPYRQVFSEKIGYIGNLSMLDLLFNEGPNSYSVIAAHLPVYESDDTKKTAG